MGMGLHAHIRVPHICCASCNQRGVTTNPNAVTVLCITTSHVAHTNRRNFPKKKNNTNRRKLELKERHPKWVQFNSSEFAH